MEQGFEHRNARENEKDAFYRALAQEVCGPMGAAMNAVEVLLIPVTVIVVVPRPLAVPLVGLVSVGIVLLLPEVVITTVLIVYPSAQEMVIVPPP